MKHLITLSLVLTISLSALAETPVSKLIVNDWKKIKRVKNGQEVAPEHQKLIIEFNRNGSFKIQAAYERTHTGQYEIKDDKTLVLYDEVSKDTLELIIEQIDKTHLVLGNYDEPGVSIHMTPYESKDAVHLTHKEHMVAKPWIITESSKKDNVGTIFEFNPNKTFIAIPSKGEGYAAGEWKMSEDHETLLVDMLEGGHIDLHIEKLSRHELKLTNTENGEYNVFSDKVNKLEDELNN